MKKTGIMTDSHSGILENEASKLGIAVKVRMWQHPSRHRRV